MDNGGTFGKYEINEEDNFKSYYIKNDNYTDSNFKKTGKVIAPIKGTSGNERFYVMALKDFSSSSYHWYYNAVENLDSNYNIADLDNDFAVADAEPTGRLNTKRMIASWNLSQYGAQDSNDMWGVIQEEVEEGWFVPSKSEWAAFGAAFGIIISNYSNTFGLSNRYWSSTQGTTSKAYEISFAAKNIVSNDVNIRRYIRLATTF